MTSPILLTGGTGTLGGHVLPLLHAAGRDVRVLTRHPRESEPGTTYVAGDLLADTGIEQAVDGVDTVLHLAGGPKGDDRATATLARAAAAAGVRHLVLISVIAADRIPLGYFRAKAGAERAVVESGVPHTVLRAAQFHDLTLTLARKLGGLPLVPAPSGMRWQPVDSREVATRLVELTLGEPAGRVTDLAGPEVRPLSDLVRDYLAARGRKRRSVPVRIPGRAGRAYRSGDNLNLADVTHGERTWADFLEEHVGAERPGGTP